MAWTAANSVPAGLAGSHVMAVGMSAGFMEDSFLQQAVEPQSARLMVNGMGLRIVLATGE